MFRRKEESLFDTDLPEENEAFVVVQPVAANASAPQAANVTAPAPAQTVVAAPAASAQPITRPSPVPPAAPANNFRPNTPISAANVSAAPLSSPIPRPAAEGKSMTPISAQNNVKANSRVLTVGNDILLKGEITTCDRLVIEGKVEATISDVNTVELAECGSFKGSANVVDAQISGLFEGDLIVTGRLVIYASGKVRGNISYGEIEIERGGELSGTIKAAGTSSSQSALPKALQKAAA